MVQVLVAVKGLAMLVRLKGYGVVKGLAMLARVKGYGAVKGLAMLLVVLLVVEGKVLYDNTESVDFCHLHRQCIPSSANLYHR